MLLRSTDLGKIGRQRGRRRREQHEGGDQRESEREPQRQPAARAGSASAARNRRRIGPAAIMRVPDRLAEHEIADAERRQHVAREARLVDRELVHRERDQSRGSRRSSPSPPAPGRSAPGCRESAGRRAGSRARRGAAASAAAIRSWRARAASAAPSRNCVNATAEAAGDRPGMTRSHNPPNAPARRMPELTGLSSTRR